MVTFCTPLPSLGAKMWGDNHEETAIGIRRVGKYTVFEYRSNWRYEQVKQEISSKRDRC